jgi:hypothetical protein
MAAAITWPGWNATGVPWARVSNTQFTLSSGTDLTAQYVPGMKLMWTESGVTKYGVVASSSFASSTTTVNLIPTTDYVMAATPDVEPHACWSPFHQPDFPSRFAYAPSVTGFSTAPSVSESWWSVSDGLCFVNLAWLVPGTSNTTGFTVNLPIESGTGASLVAGLAAGEDSGAGVAASFSIVSSNTFVTLYKGSGLGLAAASWTASGSKNAGFQAAYPI